MTEEEHQEIIRNTPEHLRPPLILLHMLMERNSSASMYSQIAEKIEPVELYEERVRMIEEYIRWLEDPEVTEEEFLRRLEKQE